MSTTVPRPMGDMPIEAQYFRSQGREASIAPIFNSQLSDVSTSNRYAPTEEFVTAAMRNLFGQANVFEAEMESLTPTVTRLYTTGDVRQFVREVAMSDSFRTRYFESVSSLRCIEVCFKNILGRAPSSQSEVSEKIVLLNGEGYEAFINSLVDSEEYSTRFGSTLIPTIAIAGDYINGMPSFNAQMKLQLPSRAGGCDANVTNARTTSVLAGNNPAGTMEIATSYALGMPSYEPDTNWMDLPMSTLLKDWASFSLVPSKAAENWSGMSTPRPTVETAEPWGSGWVPEPAGGAWKPGWAPAKKTYA